MADKICTRSVIGGVGGDVMVVARVIIAVGVNQRSVMGRGRHSRVVTGTMRGVYDGADERRKDENTGHSYGDQPQHPPRSSRNRHAAPVPSVMRDMSYAVRYVKP